MGGIRSLSIWWIFMALPMGVLNGNWKCDLLMYELVELVPCLELGLMSCCCERALAAFAIFPPCLKISQAPLGANFCLLALKPVEDWLFQEIKIPEAALKLILNKYFLIGILHRSWIKFLYLRLCQTVIFPEKKTDPPRFLTFTGGVPSDCQRKTVTVGIFDFFFHEIRPLILKMVDAVNKYCEF